MIVNNAIITPNTIVCSVAVHSMKKVCLVTGKESVGECVGGRAGTHTVLEESAASAERRRRFVTQHLAGEALRCP